ETQLADLFQRGETALEPDVVEGDEETAQAFARLQHIALAEARIDQHQAMMLGLDQQAVANQLGRRALAEAIEHRAPEWAHATAIEVMNTHRRLLAVLAFEFRGSLRIRSSVRSAPGSAMVSQSETAGLELSSLVLLHRASAWFGVPMSLRGKRHARPVTPSIVVHPDAAARAGRAGAGDRAGEGVARAGRHRPGQRRLRDPRPATGRAGRGATGGAATGHPWRAGRLHARDHP